MRPFMTQRRLLQDQTGQSNQMSACHFNDAFINFNAMNFSEWKQLSSRVLIKSNINNWLVCEPGTGSLVHWQHRSMSCQIVKRVTGTCDMTLATSNIETKGHGPFFYSTNDWATVYYYFDDLAYPKSLWNEPRKPPENVADPLTDGNIFIR